MNVLGGNKKFWGNTYGYDAWGNLVNKTKIGTACAGENLSVTADAHNWIHATGGSDFQYDAAGNMTFNATPPTQTYSYDQENRLTGAAGYSYTYDADGNRVRKSNGSTGTLYWYMTPGIVGESDLNGNLTDEYVFFDGERVARKSTNGVFYYFSDHLKTASVITDAAGNIKSESDFYPWGGELQFVNNDANRYKFTGKERDSETQLDYFGARHYSNGLGRFVTPDWAAKATAVPYAEFVDPQSLNLYSYVRNIPTSKIDKDGHCLEDACLVEAAVGVSFLVIASAQYLSLPSNQRSLQAAASSAASTIRGWFHKSDNNSKPSATPAPAAPVGATPAPTTAPAAPTGTAVPATASPAVPTGLVGTQDGKGGRAGGLIVVRLLPNMEEPVMPVKTSTV